MKHFAVLLLMIALPVHADMLPNARLTPGSVIVGVTARDVCVRGYAKHVRHVTAREKRWVRREYGLRGAHDGYCAQGCEIDHLVSLELGGSNSIRNLWPEPYHGPWNAHIKDRYENYLHRQVCRGRITLKAAQTLIRTNWIEGYRHAHLRVRVRRVRW